MWQRKEVREVLRPPDIWKRETLAAEGPEECWAGVKIPGLHLDHIYSKNNSKKKKEKKKKSFLFLDTSLFVPNLAALWEQLPLLHRPCAA